MTILPAGSFKTSTYRKAIPRRVELAVLIRQECKDPEGVPFKQDDKINFDHRPPLEERPYDTAAGDFIPPQHDPYKIFAERKGRHDKLTFGREEGAEKTATTRGSDTGNAKLDRSVRDAERIHQAKMAEKVGDPARAAELRSAIENEGRRRPGRRIQGRGFEPGKRSLRSRNNLKRVKR